MLRRFTNIVNLLEQFGIAKDVAAIIAIMGSEAKDESDAMNRALDTGNVAHIVTVYNTLNAKEMLFRVDHFKHLPILQWVHRTFDLCNMPARYTRYILRYACDTNKIEIIKWLHATLNYTSDDVCNGDDDGGTCVVKIACGEGHLEILQWLHATFDIRREISEAFREAAYHGHLHTAQWLIATFDIDVTTLGTSLSGACTTGQLEMAKWLHTEHKASFDGDEAINALYNACDRGHFNTAKWIVETFNPNFRESNGVDITILCSICAAGHLEMAKWFVNLCYDVENFINGIFSAACRSGVVEVAQWAMAFGQPYSTTVENAMASACIEGKLDMVKWLVATCKTPGLLKAADNFYSACINGHLETAQYLASIHPPHYISVHSEAAFDHAVSTGDMEMTQWLHDTFKFDKRVALDLPRTLCKGGKLSMLEWLQETFDITSLDIVDIRGDMLHYACTNGHLELAQWLQSTFGITAMCVNVPKIFEQTTNKMVIWWLERTFGADRLYAS